MRPSTVRRSTASFALGLAMMVVPILLTPLAAQSTGTIQGTVTDGASLRPLASVSVMLVGAQRGTLTDANGRFTLPNVPAGTHELRAELIGFTSSVAMVTVTAGSGTTHDFALTQSVVDLEEIVVTGVAAETSRANLPFTVERISGADLAVPPPSAAGALQGKVPGATVVAGTGRPGAAPSILLRAPTSINSAGRTQEPLYIVDGVILADGMQDIDALDIESIEVVKGAAAASLYGSRAANGVIQITTRRGRNMPDDAVRYTVRGEFGQSQLSGRIDLTQRHHFLLDSSGSQFVQQNGATCAWLECSNVTLAGQMSLDGTRTPWNTIQREAWPGGTYDHVDRFFNPGGFFQQYVAAEGRSGGTSYHVSFSNVKEEGIMPGHDGFSRNNFRVNIDQAVLSDLGLSAMAFYSRSTQNNFPEGSGNPMFNLTRMPAGVDLTALDENGELYLKPDPYNDNTNPLNELLNRSNTQQRGRFLGSVNARWNPISWLTVSGNFSYDRADRIDRSVYPKGYRTINPSATLNNGQVNLENRLTEGMNGSVSLLNTHNFGLLRSTTQLRYQYEQNEYEMRGTSGYNLGADGVYTIGNTDTNTRSGSSSQELVKADGYFIIQNFNYDDRYIIDALARNDGSSLFGADERRHWYYRGSAAWRISQEPWFNSDFISDLKLSYSYGTAGNTPRFSGQYETYTVSGGAITPGALGNRNLKPEHSAEQEFGLTLLLQNRYNFALTHARTKTTDQILPAPLLAYTGFTTQYRNAGSLESNTWEVSLDAQILNRGDFRWSGRIGYDRTRQEITEMAIPAFMEGVTGQGMDAVFYNRPGEAIGTVYGSKVATSCADLPSDVDCSQFQVNDDGILVWVGGAGSWQNGWDTYTGADGEQRHWWGTVAPFGIRGANLHWGEAILAQGMDRISGEVTTHLPVGNTMPDYNINLSSTLSWRGLSLYGLLDAVQGFDVYNQPLQWAIFQDYGGPADQSGKAEPDQKPIGYYSRLYQVSGLVPNSFFMEDASFVKLREVRLSMALSEAHLDRIPGIRAFNRASIALTGRNLVTWTNYNGYDPEVGRGGGSTGSAAIARVDGYNYPNFRTFTLSVEFGF